MDVDVQPNNHTSVATSNIIKHVCYLFHSSTFIFVPSFWLIGWLQIAGPSGLSIKDIALLCCYVCSALLQNSTGNQLDHSVSFTPWTCTDQLDPPCAISPRDALVAHETSWAKILSTCSAAISCSRIF